MMDYKRLLKDFMRWVRESEGLYYIPFKEFNEEEHIFTTEQWDALSKIRDELLEERREDNK